MDEQESGEIGSLARRLFVAFLLIVLTALVCWLVLPKAGVDVPWWVPVVAFVLIAAAALLRSAETESGESESSGDDQGV